MNKENIIKLVKEFKEVNYKDLVGALVVYEFLENEMNYQTELEELRAEDLATLENIYQKWLDDDCSGLLNDRLKEIIEEEIEEV